MEATGKLQSVQRDWKTGKILLTLAINEEPREEINRLSLCEKLNITLKKFRKKRSLDSNAYCWVLLQKIAEAVNSDKWSVYLECLQKYSREFTFVICKEHAIERLKELYRTCVDLGEVNVNGNQGHQLQVYFGSSTFDSKAMSVFIDGIIYECKQLGIETLPPDEIKRMVEQWNPQKGKE